MSYANVDVIIEDILERDFDIDDLERLKDKIDDIIDEKSRE